MSNNMQTSVKWLKVTPANGSHPFALLFWHAGFTISARIMNSFSLVNQQEGECIKEFSDMLASRPHDDDFQAKYPSLIFSETEAADVQQEFWTLTFFEQLSELKSAYADISAEAEIEITISYLEGPLLRMLSLKELYGFLSKAS